ncbi:porin [Fontimonas sp. SYSU GA230001]|uniref:porin n=1 Tax=Fontimonas sp. SYSU GA230001 TaxID=3142450 RepID=UPI0032B3D775
MTTLNRILPALTAALLASTPARAADAPPPGDIQGQIERLQSELRALKAQIDEQNQHSSAQQRADAEQQAQIDALADRIERPSATSKAKFGGYGELHYNNLDSKREIDFHRFVLYAGYDFSDGIRFVSEVELEHALAGESKPGEVELEQAYLEFDLPAQQKARGGLFLVPVGILNETHEPTTFYGVERNLVESAIIPTTWWEGGGAIGGPIAGTGLSYDLAVHSGLKLATTGSNAYAIRGGRQKVANAVADDLAYTLRLRYTGIPGLELAGTVQYQADATQALDNEQVSALLTEAHAVFERGPFSARALWAAWNLDGDGPKAVGRDRQDGYYGELGYRIRPTVGLFARYSVADNGGPADATEIRQTDIGINWWPHKDVVLKADYQNQDRAADNDGFNLGIGYRF